MIARALALVLVAVTLGLVACDTFGGDSGGDGSPQAGPTDADGGASGESGSDVEALRLYVERRLRQGFVADCEDAERPADVGKQCATFRGERGSLRAYELGPTFAEYTRLLILEQLDDGWTIAHQENRDPNLPAAPGIPWPLAVGERVIVAGTGECLRVRDAPDQQGTEVACYVDGTSVTITDGPVEADSLQWWQLDRLGWSASNWLRYPEEVPAAEGSEAEGG